MKLPIWIVDAFCSGPFTGNPSAVCPLPLDGDWPDDPTLQAIAAQHNLSETAYLVRDGAEWRLRWFTPTTEVDICGHATLAAAHVVRESLEPGAGQMAFSTRSGLLRVTADSSRLTLDFPARPGERKVAPSVAADLLGVDVLDWLEGASPVDAVAVIEREEDLRDFELDPRRVAALRPSLYPRDHPRGGLPLCRRVRQGPSA